MSVGHARVQFASIRVCEIISSSLRTRYTKIFFRKYFYTYSTVNISSGLNSDELRECKSKSSPNVSGPDLNGVLESGQFGGLNMKLPFFFSGSSDGIPNMLFHNEFAIQWCVAAEGWKQSREESMSMSFIIFPFKVLKRCTPTSDRPLYRWNFLATRSMASFTLSTAISVLFQTATSPSFCKQSHSS